MASLPLGHQTFNSPMEKEMDTRVEQQLRTITAISEKFENGSLSGLCQSASVASPRDKNLVDPTSAGSQKACEVSANSSPNQILQHSSHTDQNERFTLDGAETGESAFLCNCLC